MDKGTAEYQALRKRLFGLLDDADAQLELAESVRFARVLSGASTAVEDDAVRRAREAGTTWEAIGHAFGISRSAAHQRWARHQGGE